MNEEPLYSFPTEGTTIEGDAYWSHEDAAWNKLRPGSPLPGGRFPVRRPVKTAGAAVDAAIPAFYKASPEKMRALCNKIAESLGAETTPPAKQEPREDIVAEQQELEAQDDDTLNTIRANVGPESKSADWMKDIQPADDVPEGHRELSDAEKQGQWVEGAKAKRLYDTEWRAIQSNKVDGTPVSGCNAFPRLRVIVPITPAAEPPAVKEDFVTAAWLKEEDSRSSWEDLARKINERAAALRSEVERLKAELNAAYDGKPASNDRRELENLFRQSRIDLPDEHMTTAELALKLAEWVVERNTERLRKELDEANKQASLMTADSNWNASALEQWKKGQFAAVQRALVCEREGAASREPVTLESFFEALSASQSKDIAKLGSVNRDLLTENARLRKELEDEKKDWKKERELHKDALSQCHALQARAEAAEKRAGELEKERDDFKNYIHKIRPKADAYDRVCQSLGIENDILGYVTTLRTRQPSLPWKPVSEPPENLQEPVIVGSAGHEVAYMQFNQRGNYRTHYLRLCDLPLPPAQEDKTREAFEAWGMKDDGVTNLTTRDGKYLNPETQLAWRAWTAAAKSSHEA